MKITWNWLAELADLDLSIEQAAECLTMGGIEIEGIETLGAGLDKVICARVEEVTRHPDAERLSLCEVRTAAEQRVRVVCGAPNVRAGMKVAYAPPGASLPGGKRIEAATIRGVASAGMLCSAVELGAGDDASGLLALPDDAALGAAVAEVLGLADSVIEVSITPNRGDCLSVLGIARELAALGGGRLRPQSISPAEAQRKVADLIAIEIADVDLCSRYVGRVIEGVVIGPSPLWLQNRLRAVGLRPINNIVDATNYVMIERGQPLHAFDYDRLPAKQILVRRARAGERIVTLDDQERALEPTDLLITSGDVPVAIAGVMGGANSEVTESTTRILLESAWFEPTAVRKTSKRLGLRSEASYRFERTTDVDGVGAAADRAAEMMLGLAGGTLAAGSCDVYPGRRAAVSIRLRPERVEKLLGLAMEPDQITSRLRSFAMSVSAGHAGALLVSPPSYRSDLTREADLIEELARSIGYKNIAATLPVCAMDGAGYPPSWSKQRSLSALLTSLGMNELVLLSFCSSEDNALFAGLQSAPGNVEVINPLTQDDSQLRRSLCPGLLKVVRHNLDQGASECAGFAIGKAFWPWGDGYGEGERLGGVVCRAMPSAGIGARDQKVDFADVKGLVETVLEQFHMDADWQRLTDVSSLHPYQSAAIVAQQRRIGYLGRIHPTIAERYGIDPQCWLFELDLDSVLNYEPPPIGYAELSRFPAVVRDLAIVVEDGFESIEVVRFIDRFGKSEELIEAVQLFDSYCGEPIPAGKKSLAFSISYRAPDRTLTDQEVNDVHQRLIKGLQAQLPVELR